MPGRLEPKTLPRRDFLGLAALGSASLAIAGALVGAVRLPKPRVLPEASSRFRIGRPAEFPAGTVKILPEHNVRVMATDQGVAAISLVCTHLGCIVAETESGFACPCHGSKFNKDGKVTGGPAPRALPWLAVSQAADGTLVVDRSREARPGAFYKARG